MNNEIYYVVGFNEDDLQFELLLATVSEPLANEIVEAMSQAYRYGWFDVAASRPDTNCTVSVWRDYIDELIQIPWRD